MSTYLVVYGVYFSVEWAVIHSVAAIHILGHLWTPEDDRRGLPTGTNDAPFVSFESVDAHGQASWENDDISTKYHMHHAISCDVMSHHVISISRRFWGFRALGHVDKNKDLETHL